MYVCMYVCNYYILFHKHGFYRLKDKFYMLIYQKANPLGLIFLCLNISYAFSTLKFIPIYKYELKNSIMVTLPVQDIS